MLYVYYYIDGSITVGATGEIDRKTLKELKKLNNINSVDKEEGINDMESLNYNSVTKKGDFNVNSTLLRLKEENFLKDEYMVYEKNGESRIVFGKYAQIVVSDKKITITEQGEVRTIEAKDPIMQLGEILNEVSLSDWTAYGYLAFDVIKYYHTYDKKSRQPEICFFIPKTELLFCENKVNIKSLDDIEKVVDCLDTKVISAEDLKCNINMVTSDKDEYMSRVDSCVSAIKDKFLTKAIISRRNEHVGDLDVYSTYLLANQINNSARAYAFEIDQIKAVGSSPEILLLREESDGKIITNPLAGTRHRGDSVNEDLALKRELFDTPKEVKEHALSVLLAQEEIASICENDSVHVYDFMEVKQYRCVQHLSSRVGGVLQENKTIYDALKVLFPGITVSGISKSDAIQWINKLEDSARGIYAGAIGWIDSNNCVDLAIAIRSVYQYNNEIVLNAGAGIVQESDPEFEFTETYNKMNTIGNSVIIQNLKS